MQPKISVIVPVYKAEKYLHRCVDSILAQTFTDFELILVDDGSPDNSGAICDEYAAKDNRVKVIHKENGGASDARNKGLDNATGEIVCFVDSDDYIAPEFFKNFGNCNADITIQGLYGRLSQKEQYNYLAIKEGKFNNDHHIDFLNIVHQAKNSGYLVTRAFKRKIIEKNNLRLNTKYRLREDEEFIWRYMLKCNSFATIDKGAYYYDMPDFSSKYSFVNIETDFECTVSIIENCAKFCKCYQHPHIVNNINRLASLVLNSYRKKEYSVQDTKEYINKFREFYKKVKGDKLLTMKSKIVYNIIGAHTPLFIHKLYNIILKFH